MTQPTLLAIGVTIFLVGCGVLCLLSMIWADLQPQPAQGNTPGVYYLWYKGQSHEKVAVMGPSQRSVPVDGNQLANWVLSGTACVADPDTKAYRGSTNGPAFTVGIEIAEGPCRGFVGWVPMEAFQMARSW